MPLPAGDCLGYIRIWDGDGDETSIIDMGPYEFGSFLLGIQKPRNSYNKGIETFVYPNPFSRSTTIEYELTKPEKVTLTIYDYSGKLIYELQENQLPGLQKVKWTSDNLPAGMYYFTLEAGEQLFSGEMVRIK